MRLVKSRRTDGSHRFCGTYITHTPLCFFSPAEIKEIFFCQGQIQSSGGGVPRAIWWSATGGLPVYPLHKRRSDRGRAGVSFFDSTNHPVSPHRRELSARREHACCISPTLMTDFVQISTKKRTISFYIAEKELFL